MTEKNSKEADRTSSGVEQYDPDDPQYAAYFYAVDYPNISQSDHHDIRAYYWEEVPPPKQLPPLDQVVGELVDAAMNGAAKHPVRGDSFDSFLRRRKGYFIVAVTGAEFLSGHNPIKFRIAASSSHAKGDGSHTFEYIRSDTIDSNGRKVSVAIYYSHAKSRKTQADLAPDEWELFELDLRVRMRMTDTYEDSGGVNMGPPPRPPGLHDARAAAR